MEERFHGRKILPKWYQNSAKMMTKDSQTTPTRGALAPPFKFLFPGAGASDQHMPPFIAVYHLT